jgi:hypothetical protein
MGSSGIVLANKHLVHRFGLIQSPIWLLIRVCGSRLWFFLSLLLVSLLFVGAEAAAFPVVVALIAAQCKSDALPEIAAGHIPFSP